jgi:tetratricopeptide (TPR) repeat protein
MTNRLKYIITGTAAALVGGAGLLAWLLRPREHVAVVTKAVQAATASGIVLTAAGPAMIGDKISGSINSFVQLLGISDDQAVAARANQLHEALLEGRADLLDRWLDSGQVNGDPVALVNAALVAIDQPEISDQSRRRVLGQLVSAYPATDDKLNHAAAPVYARIAVGLWHHGDPRDALTYSSQCFPAMLAAAQSDDPQDGTAPLQRMLKGYNLLAINDASAAATDAGNAFLSLARDHVDGGALTQHPSLAAPAAEVLTAFFVTGQHEEGMAYYASLAEALAGVPDPQGSLIRLAKTITQQIEQLDETQAEECYAAMMGIANEPVARQTSQVIWASSMNRLNEEATRRLYQRFAKDNPHAVADVAHLFLRDSPKSVALDQIMIAHFEIIAYDIEAGIRSAAFDHLIKELNGRNAHADAEAVIRFVLDTFPTEPIGAQALILWSGSERSPARAAQIQVASNELITSYPDEPIARLAKALLVREQVDSGRTLEGLLQAQAMFKNQSYGSQTVLSLGLLNTLITDYQAYVESAGLEADRVRVLTGLADQLAEAGEYPLASVLYWQVTRELNRTPHDPRTGGLFEAPVLANRTGDLEPETRFWRGMALVATGQRDAAIQELEALVGGFSSHALCDPARLILAENLDLAKNPTAAWGYLQDVSRELLQTERGAQLFARLAKTIPNEQQHADRVAKIAALREALANNNGAVRTDAALMELGDLLRLEGKPANALMHYEQLIRDFPRSDLTAEAIYQAIEIYRLDPTRAERARELTKLLKNEYSESRYADLVAG